VELSQSSKEKRRRTSMEKAEGKEPLGRPRSRWEDNIPMGLHEI
jgi:hypothetical protein